MQSETINELAAALAKAQSEIKGATKDSANPFFKSKYADLASVWASWQEVGPKNGLAIAQVTQFSEAGMTLETMLMHNSGQWITSSYPIKPIKDDPQGMGSAITYARRYALSAMVGIAPEDDDGNAASGKADNGRAPAQRSAPAKAAPKTADDELKEIAKTVSDAIAKAQDTDTLDVILDDPAMQDLNKRNPTWHAEVVKRADKRRRELTGDLVMAG